MGRLVLSRRADEQIRLTLKPGASIDDFLDELEQVGIWITVVQTDGGRARLAIEAPEQLLVLRDELIPGHESFVKLTAGFERS
ncbi:MAG: carbon storage regulator [Gammaproteobacteria bacterium HGW-Gammaproteobacteria-5]|uniref:carbon storage regulator n=1 Tax=Stutzerimonas stutzeri TaxID=316 RepID=UPI000CC18D8A|nr:carbon storage regulator [Stutzerimonas stutzeri]MBA1227983.1 carbon storage regulator [Stutzerimonas stutzeri]MBU2138730.1 carbon storage regulator [Gammaproteobacteria bacterium]PKM13893.1 MAG: carbon storage regulator [Gammaproteobacteria bacterium HGW-Gammaproteobacteria-5]